MSRGVPHTAKSSDQMPEEAPAEQVPDDDPDAPEGAARESGRRHAERANRGAHERDDAGKRSLGDDAKHERGR